MPRVHIERTKPYRFAYIEHRGAYDAIPFETDFRRLYGWAKENRVRPGFHPMGVYYDMPDETPPEGRRAEIGIPFSGRAKPAADVRIRTLPGTKVAAISFRGPSREYATAYRALGAWIEENGYRWAGPAIEVYSKRPEVRGGETILFARIKAPVKRK